MQNLDPPYDGWAEWHAHFFAPDGGFRPMAVPPATNGLCPDGVICRTPDYGHCHEFGCHEVQANNESVGRYDAVQDRLARIFVWDVMAQQVVQLCSTREEACRIAKGLATI